MLQQKIFGDKNYKQKLANFSVDNISELKTKIEIISKYIKALESGRIERTKEEAIQADFLNKFFGEILGYVYDDSNLWNIEKEYKSVTDGTKADGALGFFTMNGKNIDTDVRAVVELKDALTDLDKPQNRQSDKRTPVEQAFSYSSKAGGRCKWVIVSNFKEIRFYHASDQSRYEIFVLQELLNDDNLKKFFFLLQKERLISKNSESFVDILYRERQEAEQIISKLFYNHYKNLRIELFEHLKKNNPDNDELTLLTKTQKLLDRFIFVCFCEDRNLLPAYTSKKVKDILKNAFDFYPFKLWRQLTGLFQSINIGNPPLEINKFNGGLFTKDDEFDNLIIKDEILLKLLAFSEFDFDSDLNVNILGHIFEQSLSDIEELKAQIGNGKELSNEEKSEVRKTGKRKKDGIFYTPEYITRYIVKEAIGGWLEDRKQELGFYNLPELTSADFATIKPENKKGSKLKYNAKVEAWLKFWEAYKEQLLNVKVLDPACGSGAFLNQAFDYLFIEGRKVSEEISRLRLGQREVFELDRHILTNNIFGVDLNPESVEITKLSLWLKTANRGKELTALEENIKCGNSLIDDPAVAGDKVFNWFTSFPSVFPNYRKPKEKETDFIEEPTYNYGNPESKGFIKFGFDVVIGNPPYGATLSENHIEHFRKNYSSFEYQVNSYVLFYERGISIIKDKGYLAFITPATFTYQHFFQKIRAIFNKYDLISVCKYQYEVFEDADVGDTVSWVLKKSFNPENITFIRISTSPNNIEVEYSETNRKLIDDKGVYKITDNRIDVNFSTQSFKKLGEIAQIIVGIKPYQVGKGDPKQTREIVNNRVFSADTPIDNTFKRCIVGKDFNRYTMLNTNLSYISYGKWLAEPREIAPFFKEKIIIRQTSDSLIGNIDVSNSVNLNNVYNISSLNESEISNYYLLALINSRLFNHIYQSISQEKGRIFAEVKKVYLEQLPYKIISLAEQQPFIEKVEIMLSKNKQLQEIKQSFIQLTKSKWSTLNITNKLNEWYNLSFEEFRKELEKQKIKLSLQEQAEWMQYFNEQKQTAELIQNTISQTDKEIDELVYQLYELAEDEKAIINS
ncbi:MAG: TaqI-like C-terminal specificity domain-containing protein [Draconibacterium sp.]|nr:TaqI-like C-terminal specificity domain-containing protein [Draconibacterium sp.]